MNGTFTLGRSVAIAIFAIALGGGLPPRSSLTRAEPSNAGLPLREERIALDAALTAIKSMIPEGSTILIFVPVEHSEAGVFHYRARFLLGERLVLESVGPDGRRIADPKSADYVLFWRVPDDSGVGTVIWEGDEAVLRRTR